MADGPLDALMRHLRHLASPAARTQEPDSALLARFAARGDADAFEELLRRHGGMVLGVCRRLLRDPHDAEDAFQATMLTLARKAGRIRRPDALAAWLRRVASCAALQARLAAARRSAHERCAPARAAADPLQEVSAREAQAALDEELASLPERCRAPLILCYLEGRYATPAG